MKRTKFIAIASGKGGVGKTTVSINLASALSKLDNDVTVVDADLMNPNVSLYLGHEKVEANLHTAIKGETRILESIYSHPSGLKVVPASISLHDLEFSDYSELGSVLEDLRGYSDYVIIDTHPGINSDAQKLFKLADEIIVVTVPELTAATDAVKTIRMAESLGTPVIGVVLNRVEGRSYEMSLEEVESFLEKPIIGIVPEDRRVKKSVIDNYPIHNLYPRSGAASAFDKAAAHVTGDEIPVDGFFTEFLRIFKIR